MFVFKFKNKLIYLLSLSIISISIITISPVLAGWGLPIQPGDEVIDIKRLQDSILMTSKKALEAVQSLEMFNNRFKFNTGISSEADKAANLVSNLNKETDSILDKLKGPFNLSKIADNPDPKKPGSINSAWGDFMPPKDNEILNTASMASYGEKIRNSIENSFYDSLSLTKNNTNNSRKLMEEINTVSTMSKDGVLGEKQAANISRANIIAMQNNSMIEDSSIIVAEATLTKAELSHEDIGQRQTATAKLGSYDPYNRTEDDDRLSPAKKPIGFPEL